jgi:hypothetical protein
VTTLNPLVNLALCEKYRSVIAEMGRTLGRLPAGVSREAHVM